jgi:5-methylcytosine-specific restriction endonuclease McrA
MSKKQAEKVANQKNIHAWRRTAKVRLFNLGVKFDKDPKNSVLADLLKQHNITISEDSLIYRRLTRKSSKPKETKQAHSQPNPIGYVSRCRQDEPFDLKPEVFYKSWRWKEIRLIALDVCGHRCGSCGQKPLPNNNVVLHVDHIQPLRKNPELALDLSNLQVLCEDCNQGKSWFNTKDYRTEEQKAEMIRRQFESAKITDEVISRMHESRGDV